MISTLRTLYRIVRDSTSRTEGADKIELLLYPMDCGLGLSGKAVSWNLPKEEAVK